MKLIVEAIQDFEYITEDVDGKKSLYITGPFLVQETVNRNNRFYPAAIMDREVNRYIKECIQENRGFGELNHPPSPGIGLDRVAILTKSLILDGNNWIGKAKICDTPMGNIAKSLILDGARLGVSSRGMGSLKQDESRGCQVVQDDFHIATAADLVADPSAPGAYVRGIMEGVDWLYDESLGGYVQQRIEDTKKALSRETIQKIEEMSLKVFEDLMREISTKAK